MRPEKRVEAVVEDGRYGGRIHWATIRWALSRRLHGGSRSSPMRQNSGSKAAVERTRASMSGR